MCVKFFFFFFFGDYRQHVIQNLQFIAFKKKNNKKNLWKACLPFQEFRRHNRSKVRCFRHVVRVVWVNSVRPSRSEHTLAQWGVGMGYTYLTALKTSSATPCRLTNTHAGLHSVTRDVFWNNILFVLMTPVLGRVLINECCWAAITVSAACLQSE